MSLEHRLSRRALLVGGAASGAVIARQIFTPKGVDAPGSFDTASLVPPTPESTIVLPLPTPVGVLEPALIAEPKKVLEQKEVIDEPFAADAMNIRCFIDKIVKPWGQHTLGIGEDFTADNIIDLFNAGLIDKVENKYEIQPLNTWVSLSYSLHLPQTEGKTVIGAIMGGEYDLLMLESQINEHGNFRKNGDELISLERLQEIAPRMFEVPDYCVWSPVIIQAVPSYSSVAAYPVESGHARVMRTGSVSLKIPFPPVLDRGKDF